jgi:hypothetical protein
MSRVAIATAMTLAVTLAPEFASAQQRFRPSMQRNFSRPALPVMRPMVRRPVMPSQFRFAIRRSFVSRFEATPYYAPGYYAPEYYEPQTYYNNAPAYSEPGYYPSAYPGSVYSYPGYSYPSYAYPVQTQGVYPSQYYQTRCGCY